MLQEKNGIFYITFDIFKALSNVTAAVSARKGGVSGAPFASLNMSFSSGDDSRHVLENRRRYLSALHVVPEHIICCNQVHGVNVVQAGRADRGRGALERESAIPSCDGLMTDEAGVPTQVETVPNPSYVEGRARETLEFINDVLPSGQGVQMASIPGENWAGVEAPYPARWICCSLAFCTVMTGAGLLLFKRKEIR